MARFLRRLSGWRALRRWLFVGACLATLIGLFYAVEDWRGKRAWDKCRRELEAQGAVLDWNAYIPAPVPDDQNVFKAPKMAEWFLKEPSAAAASSTEARFRDTEGPFSLAPAWNTKRAPLLLAQVDVVPAGGPLPPEKADAVFRPDDPAACEAAAKLLDDFVGPRLAGARGNVIVAGPAHPSEPLYLLVRSDAVPTVRRLTAILSHSPVPNKAGTTPDRSYFQVDRFGTNGFDVLLMPSADRATNYLAMSQPAVPGLDLLRQALQRPYARRDGDNQRPFEQPIPYFVRLRTVAQILSQRAQCHLLLGQPEAAWHELVLVREMCRLLEGSPPRNATTLVAAMIEVAITGLYVQVVEDGLRLQAWREPELAAMQKQIQDVNLLPLFQQAINTERAATCRVFQLAPRARLFALAYVPRGWIYQNMCAIALRDQMILETLDVPKDLVLPRSADDIHQQVSATRSHFAPYNFLAAIVVPNFVRAAQVMARTQTRLNEAFLACGLERYRLAHGQYPETLDALVPEYAEKLPHDIIGGQPLKYHRTADGQFVLYSIGWNEKDDGGLPGKSDTEGDWVWQPPTGP